MQLGDSLSFYLGLFILREIPRFFYSRTCPSSVSQRRGFALPDIRRFLSACGGLASIVPGCQRMQDF